MLSTPSEPALVLDGVTKSFREGTTRRVVLEGAGFTLPRGEIAVLLGRSGSGKSTLLNLAAGLDTPDEGVVRVAGEAVSTLSERRRTLFRRRALGFVFQSFNLLPTLTVEENVRLGCELAGSPEEVVARALLRLERLGLGDRRGAWPERLSGGEQQRVAIAAALAHEPDLVLADEPTGNLDATTASEVVQLLEEEVRRVPGRSLLMVTHAEEMVGIADRLVRIEARELRVTTPEVRA